jgi:hypothetical protein
VETAATAVPPSGAAPNAAEATTDPAPGKADRELRDCRTFVDASGQKPWVAGTELVNERKGDGPPKFRVTFFAQPAGGRERVTLRTAQLASEREAQSVFEAATAQELKDGSWLLTARYRGSLHAWILGADKRPRRPMQVFRGGYPSVPRFFAEGTDQLFVLTQKAGDARFELFFGRIESRDTKLPAALTSLTLGAEATPASGAAPPMLARAGEQRWLGYHGSEGRRASLLVVPLDAKLSPMGPGYTVVSGDPGVQESILVGLTNGRLLAIYLRGGEPTELVSELLSCDVRP